MHIFIDQKYYAPDGEDVDKLKKNREVKPCMEDSTPVAGGG